MSYPNQYYGGETVTICPNCGAQNAATEPVCRNCGNVLNAQQPQYQQPQYQDPYQQPQYQQPQYQDGQYPQYQNGQYPQYQDGQYPQYQQPGYPVDNGSDVDPMDVQQNKLMAVLAYLSILVLIPIFAAPNSRFARFHANQGLILWIAGIAWSFVTGLITGFFGAISAEIAAVFSALLGIASLVFVVLAILGIVNAVKGVTKELPVIGKLRLLK